MAQKRKKGKSKAYSGYMKFPLCGAQTHNEFKSSCEFFGDFADPTKRYQIFNRPRKYRMEIWLRIKDKPEYEVSEMALPVTAVDKKQLAEILHQYAVQDIKELMGREEVDLERSYFKVIL